MGTTDWTHGYVVDASYADTFFRELSPAWLNYVRALNGLGARDLDRPFSYIELGCGFGNSTVVNAAAFPSGEFHACELNPVHVAGGRRYASALGVGNVTFHETSFQELDLSELPPFDFVVMHGVYSWVDAESRAATLRIIRERLAPGGLVYVSYNCMPGWTSELPLRRLMVELAAPAPGTSDQRMQHAVDVLTRLRDKKLRFFETTPAASQAIDAYNKVPSNYLVHEFLNDTWQPFYSVDVADDMKREGLEYLGSATLVDNHAMLLVGDAAAQGVASLATPRQQNLALDFATDRRFRRDVFVHGAAPRAPGDLTRSLETAIVGSIDDPRFLDKKIQVPRGNISFDADFIHQLRAIMSRASTTIGEAVSTLGGRGRNVQEITRNLAFLVAGGALSPFAKAAPHPPAPKMPRATDIVERTLAYAIETRTPRAIPSQMLGNGVLVSPVEALAIVLRLEGADSVDRLASELEKNVRERALDAADEPSGRPRAGDDLTAHAKDVATRVTERLLPSLARLGLVA